MHADLIMEFLSEHGVDSIEKLKSILEPSAYAIIPVAILEDPNITPNSKLLYAELMALARKGGKCFATNRHLKERLGVSLRTIQNCLLELQGLDMIKLALDKNPSGTWRTIEILWKKEGVQKLHGGMQKLRGCNAKICTPVEKESASRIHGVQKLHGGVQKLHAGGMQKLHAGHAASCTPGVQEAAPHKRVSRKRELKKTIASASDAASLGKQECKFEGCGGETIKEKEFCKLHQSMDVRQFVEWCTKGKSQHIHIIGEWADTLKPQLETVAQWEEFIQRNLRTAKRLIPFSQDQLEVGWEKIKANRAAGWLTEFTLETLLKYVTNAKTI